MTTTITKPDKRAIRRLIDAAIREKVAAKVHDKKFEQIKAKLAELGIRYRDEWEPTAGGGSSWFAQGTGFFARVTYPADKLRDAIDASSKGFVAIRTAAGDAFKHLFEAANFYKPVAKFREKAVEILGADKARKLVKLCESDNKPTVNFEAGVAEDREDR